MNVGYDSLNLRSEGKAGTKKKMQAEKDTEPGGRVLQPVRGVGRIGERHACS